MARLVTTSLLLFGPTVQLSLAENEGDISNVSPSGVFSQGPGGHATRRMT